MMLLMPTKHIKIGEIGFIVTSTFILKSGGGIHMWDLQLRRFFQILYVSSVTQSNAPHRSKT